MTDPGPLTCQQLVELVTDYFEGALAAPERARFEAHLGGCDWCTAYVGQVRRTVEVVARVDPEGLDPRVEAQLLDAFRRWKGQDSG